MNIAPDGASERYGRFGSRLPFGAKGSHCAGNLAAASPSDHLGNQNVREGKTMKTRLSKYLWLIVAASALGILFPGCAWQIGGDKPGNTVCKPTRGQELIDLKKARDQGAITEDEYQAQRKTVLERL